MSQETTPNQRLLMALVAVLLGLFLIFIAPFIAVRALNTPLHRLVEVFQVQEPDGVWDTPVKILTATYYVWMTFFVFAGAALLVIANDIRKGVKWARPLALALLSIPSIGGMTMTIPWLVLVMGDALGNKNPDAGVPPALSIMGLGLLGYFIVLLAEKADWKTKLAQVVVFTTTGVVGGFVWMNAQHGVRYFSKLPSAPFMEASESVPELFLGGYVNYAAVLLLIPAIGLMAARKRAGLQLALVGALVTFAVALLAFLDRVALNPVAAQEWLRGALLSAVMAAVLVIPFFSQRILGEKGASEA
ncbi:MAG: hypothetical protein L0Z70_09230 [Chloroflexi bacterium]|nr:hypothetical protein [Chloroflexota bacterium]